MHGSQASVNFKISFIIYKGNISDIQFCPSGVHPVLKLNNTKIERRKSKKITWLTLNYLRADYLTLYQMPSECLRLFNKVHAFIVELKKPPKTHFNDGFVS